MAKKDSKKKAKAPAAASVTEEGFVKMYQAGYAMEACNGSLSPIFGMEATKVEGGAEVLVPLDKYESELGRDHGRLLTEEQFADYMASQLDEEDD